MQNSELKTMSSNEVKGQNHALGPEQREGSEGSKLEIRVPATSANLGPGFDVLGLALDLHNEFAVSLADTTRIEIEGGGYNEGMPLDESNLFYRAFAHLYQAQGKQ